MSENITHFSSMEDCFHMMDISQEICPEFKTAGKKYYNLARLASVTRYGDNFTAPLMGEIREQYRNGTFDDFQQRKLIYVLGWLCHRAADRCMKPVFSAIDAKTLRHAEAIDYSPSECSVYNDAFIYKLYYEKEQDGLYPDAVFEDHADSIPGHDQLDVQKTRQLIRVLMQNSLIAMHHADRTEGGPQAWFQHIDRRRQRFTLEVERYAEAIHTPDPQKYKRYITDVSFYDGSEPITELAVKLRSNGTASEDELQLALATKPHSSYAHILRTGTGYLLAASQFFKGDMTVEELKDHFDIGKLGRDGEPA